MGMPSNYTITVMVPWPAGVMIMVDHQLIIKSAKLGKVQSVPSWIATAPIWN